MCTGAAHSLTHFTTTQAHQHTVMKEEATRNPWQHQPHRPPHRPPQSPPLAGAAHCAGYGVPPHVQHAQPGAQVTGLQVHFNPQIARPELMAPAPAGGGGGGVHHPVPYGYPGGHHPVAPLAPPASTSSESNANLLNSRRNFYQTVQSRLIRHLSSAIKTQTWFIILKECSSGRGIMEEYYADDETLLRVNFLALNIERSTAADLELELKYRYLSEVNEFRAQVILDQPSRLIMYYPTYQGMLDKLYSCALDVEGRLEHIIKNRNYRVRNNVCHPNEQEQFLKELAALKLPELRRPEHHSPTTH